MDNYYDPAIGDWVTDRTRYERVLAEPRFDAIRECELHALPLKQAWALILELLAAVPEDAVHHVGAGPLEDLVRRHPSEVIDLFETELIQNEKLLRAGLNMHLSRGDLPAAAEGGLSAALGPQFYFLNDRTG